MKKSTKVIAVVNATVLCLMLVQGCASSGGRTAGIRQKKTPEKDQKVAPEPTWQPTTGPQDTPPAPAPQAREVASVYTVVKNDTLGQIALKHGVRWRDLASFNNLSNPDKLYIGQRLEIPPSTFTPRDPSSSSRSPSSGGSGGRVPADGNYTVVQGDTLGGIAQHFGIRLADLLADNNLTEKSVIRVGQRLKVRDATGSRSSSTGIASAPEPMDTYSPTSPVIYVPYPEEPAADTTGFKRYTVQEGDDVYSVSIKHGVQPGELRQANNISGSELIPGQTIKIPPSSR